MAEVKRFSEYKDDLAGEYAAFLRTIKWKSVDKDNMEFEARITYSQMDAIREILESWYE